MSPSENTRLQTAKKMSPAAKIHTKLKMPSISNSPDVKTAPPVVANDGAETSSQENDSNSDVWTSDSDDGSSDEDDLSLNKKPNKHNTSGATKKQEVHDNPFPFPPIVDAHKALRSPGVLKYLEKRVYEMLQDRVSRYPNYLSRHQRLNLVCMNTIKNITDETTFNLSLYEFFKILNRSQKHYLLSTIAMDCELALASFCRSIAVRESVGLQLIKQLSLITICVFKDNGFERGLIPPDGKLTGWGSPKNWISWATTEEIYLKKGSAWSAMENMMLGMAFALLPNEQLPSVFPRRSPKSVINRMTMIIKQHKNSDFLELKTTLLKLRGLAKERRIPDGWAKEKAVVALPHDAALDAFVYWNKRWDWNICEDDDEVWGPVDGVESKKKGGDGKKAVFVIVLDDDEEEKDVGKNDEQLEQQEEEEAHQNETDDEEDEDEPPQKKPRH